jgi:hypothetical protein
VITIGFAEADGSFVQDLSGNDREIIFGALGRMISIRRWWWSTSGSRCERRFVGPRDRSRNHPAFCQLELAVQATGVASHGRTKSPLGSSDFDTSGEREGKGVCRSLEADVAVDRAWFFPPVVFERAQRPPHHGDSTVHPWVSILSRCLSRTPPMIAHANIEQSSVQCMAVFRVLSIMLN